MNSELQFNGTKSRIVAVNEDSNVVLGDPGLSLAAVLHEFNAAKINLLTDVFSPLNGAKEERGTFGMVVCGTLVGASPPVPAAMKRLMKDHFKTTEAVQRLRDELTVLAAFKTRPHPSVNHSIGVFHTDTAVYIALHTFAPDPAAKFCDDGFYFIKSDRWSVASAMLVMRNVLSGVSELHERGIAHRDIKPENTLILESPNAQDGIGIQILDFGLVRIGPFGCDWATPPSTVGTASDCAPEVIRAARDKQSRFTLEDLFRADVFSIGCLAFAFFNRARAFPSVNGKGEAYQRGNRTDFRHFCPDAIKRWVVQLLDDDPLKRPTAAEALRTFMLIPPSI